MTLGGAATNTWSNRQASVSLSPAEYEFYAAFKVAAQMMGFAAVVEGSGWSVRTPLNLWVDAGTAQWMANKAGLTRAKQMEIRFLCYRKCWPRASL